MKAVTLVLATNNRHKVREIKDILKKSRLKINIKTLDAFPRMPEVVENKRTIEGNAAKKAREIAKRTGCVALADDTGLFVRALNGRPGVYSARFAGPKCTYDDNCFKLLRLLKKKTPSQRGATFRTVAALSTPGGQVFLVKGQIKGKISTEFRGKKGFGYDPVFWVPGINKTFAEMSLRLKNKISHRALAFSKIPRLLKKVLKDYNN